MVSASSERRPCGADVHFSPFFSFSSPADNVHFQQAAEISEALVEEQVDFEAMVIVFILCWSNGGGGCRWK